ncbi:MAG: heparinase II/III family protein, partial [Pseudomonadota bacterium]
MLAARRARPAGGFVSQPEPRSIGLYTRGKQIVAGNILLAGHLAEAPGTLLWDIAGPDAFVTEAQGFAWLDDLAALGTKDALARAQDWTWGWIARYGKGKGPGWTPDLTGRRIIRWVHHATILLQARDKAQSAAYYAALSRQATYLARRWRSAAEGLPRFEALTGLVYAGISLIGMEALVAPATQALAAACDTDIDAEGGIPTRNPEELLEVLTLLTWSASAMSEANLAVPPALSHAITRIAPALRALRHADGELARFHGGGRSAEGRLDQALASAAVRAGATPAIAMGYARLHGGRTSVIVDAAAPPGGRAARTAHASTTAFELTSGRRPVVVNC